MKPTRVFIKDYPDGFRVLVVMYFALVLVIPMPPVQR